MEADKIGPEAGLPQKRWYPNIHASSSSIRLRHCAQIWDSIMLKGHSCSGGTPFCDTARGFLGSSSEPEST